MKFSVLGSGSKGNSVFIQSQKTTVLIDAGFSGKQIATRLEAIGEAAESINAILLTHEHGDHISAAGVLSRRYKIPLVANEGTLRGGESKLGKLHETQEFETGDVFSFQDLEIRSFRVFHDTNDPIGYVISDGQKSIAYCTDTGKSSHLMQQRLSNCDAIILEFNHDPQMLKEGPYPLALQQRVRSTHGHLSNEDAAEILKNIVCDRLKHVVLAHLSDTNNLPALALKAAAAVPANPELNLVLAEQDYPLPIISL